MRREAEDARGGRPAARATRGTRAAPAARPREIARTVHATARPIARHGLNARKTSPNRIAQRHQRQPEDHEDEDRRPVRGRCSACPRSPRRWSARSRKTPIAPQTISTGRLASTRPSRPAAAASRVLQPRLRPQGGERDERDHQHDRGRPPEDDLRHRQVRADRDAVGDQEHALRQSGSTVSLRHQRLATGVLGHVALDLEDALDVGRELEGRGLARLDVLLDVVAVQVDVVVRVGADDDA